MRWHLHDLRGGPDILAFDADTSPRQGERSFYVRVPSLETRQVASDMAPPFPLSIDTRGLQEAERSRCGEPAFDSQMLRRAIEAGATGFVLPGTVGVADIERFGAMLAVAEAETGFTDGALAIVAIVDGPAGVLALPSLRPTPRLAALACDPGHLAATLGCDDIAPAVSAARAMTVLAASACGVRPAVIVKDASPRLRGEARREGFGAVLVAGDE